MNKVYLVSAKRSAIGTMLGTLKDVSPTYLGAQVLKAAIAEAGITHVTSKIVDEGYEPSRYPFISTGR